ncbi:membrane protease YdiL (CAAX protease family) [Sphingomonas kyeonggiensis]|uniref:CPBP family glutamic-type intramembrane protease n=1 Tax=Sphingomonas kyeonggiensis TaxID=1268553 RepID=UPI002783A4CC|nr:CPBP family glutamic-type intramembrane protease [Sphingomonas kyeonggiensis]MDQ0248319.1 membrane protease YdiL (CAAX protease family) [Sphingomonas kyeonggiensis]
MMWFGFSPQPLAAALVLIAILIWSIRNDGPEYRSFKVAAGTRERQAYFRRWLMKGIALYTLTPLAVLACLGRLEALIGAPDEFAAFRSVVEPSARTARDQGFPPALVAGMLIAVVLGAVIAVAAARLFGGGKPKAIGDVEPMLPRNNEERRWLVALSLNAGVGEELFFRLLLPLLLMLGGIPLVISFAIAALAFGAVHSYQGLAGVLATTLLAAFLSFLYLRTGLLWAVVLFHIVINLNGLILRPWLSGQRGKNIGENAA